jgi:hypothetical protein
MHLLGLTFRFQLSSGKTILSAAFRVKLESAMRNPQTQSAFHRLRQRNARNFDSLGAGSKKNRAWCGQNADRIHARSAFLLSLGERNGLRPLHSEAMFSPVSDSTIHGSRPRQRKC